jgi:hypothetical protein
MRGLRSGAALVAIAMLAGTGAAQACGDGTVVFEDSFDSFQPTWGKTTDELMVDNGELIMKPKADFTLWAPNTSAIYDDVDLCVNVTSVESIDANNSFAGVVFWYIDDSNYYTLEIDADGYASVWRRQKGRWLSQVDWVKVDNLTSGDGSTNELRVVTKGNVATYYLNGDVFREAMGVPPDNGQQVGTIASSPKKGVATYSFDDFTVSKVE